jgi:phenylalanyl-tRNA synthetase beta chain
MSMIGVAIEAAAVLGHEYKPSFATPPKGEGKIGDHLSVQVLEGERCPRYTARIISGVKIAASPDWLAKRLELAESVDQQCGRCHELRNARIWPAAASR